MTKAIRLNDRPGTDIVDLVSSVVSEITGVQLGERQRTMVQSRLQRRIMDLGLGSEAEYASYFAQHREVETEAMVSLLTTHHTYFFREFAQFEYLLDQGLANVIAHVRNRNDRTLKVWSAACSRGQEVYSLSMLLASYLPVHAPDIKYEILGTDVDPESVKIAKNGVYSRKDIKEIPAIYAGNHWARGTGEISNFVKAKSSIKAKCRFEVANLLHLDEKTSHEKFDIIFCRNVFIYFTQAQIKDITQGLIGRLNPHGLFLVGISETLNGLDLPMTSLGPSIYGLTEQNQQKSSKILGHEKRKDEPSKAGANVVVNIASALPKPATSVHSSVPATRKPIRVFCIDDSSSIITLLKQILSSEPGFEFVGSAENGLDAAKKLQAIDADVITLDIHMPQQDGLEYLKKNFNSNHPPVVMISSVAREEGDLALKCLEQGASDYIEKPSLSNMAERGDEIRTKLRSAVRAKAASSVVPQTKSQRVSEVDKSFSSNLKPIDTKKSLRVIVAGFSDAQKLNSFFREVKNPQPPTLILVEGMGNALPSFAQKLENIITRRVTVAGASLAPLAAGDIQIADASKHLSEAKKLGDGKVVSILVYGDVSKNFGDKILTWSGAQLLVEDRGQGVNGHVLGEAATDIVPYTSFAYMSSQYLGK